MDLRCRRGAVSAKVLDSSARVASMAGSTPTPWDEALVGCDVDDVADERPGCHSCFARAAFQQHLQHAPVRVEASGSALPLQAPGLRGQLRAQREPGTIRDTCLKQLRSMTVYSMN